jgi:isopenicillin N synthase-like dioxygenase
MAVEELALPLIDISRYFHPETPTDRGDVIAQVCDACRKYGFVQIQGHGVPIEVQQGLLRSIDRVFDQSKEEKLKLSFLDNPCRRGYEASGMSLRDGDALPDSKEVKSVLSFF